MAKDKEREPVSEALTRRLFEAERLLAKAHLAIGGGNIRDEISAYLKEHGVPRSRAYETPRDR